MKRGDRVLVKAFPDKELQRIVWEEGNTYVVVCRPEIYEEAMKSRVAPTLDLVMGFPKEDVKLL